MRIAVCIKQVPAYSEGSMDEKTGRIIRANIPVKVNPADLIALETALRIKEENGARVDVFTMGPKKAEEAIRDAYAMGADQGYLISDKAFSGADVLATSYTLMQAIKAIGPYDLIVCGKQTTDGDTGQVGGAIAKWLQIPHFNGVINVITAGETDILLEQETEQENLQLKMAYPCLLAMEADAVVPRLPSLKLRMQGRKKEITVLDASRLSGEQQRYGLHGSATKVVRIFPPERTPHQKTKAMEGEEAAVYILSKVRNIFGGEDFLWNQSAGNGK